MENKGIGKLIAILAVIVCLIVAAGVAFMVYQSNQPSQDQAPEETMQPVEESNADDSKTDDGSKGSEDPKASEDPKKDDGSEKPTAPERGATQNGANDYSALKAEVEKIISSSKGKVAFAMLDCETGKGINVEGDKSLVAASTVKLAIMAELFDRVNSGKVSLDDKSEASGNTFDYLCGEMISHSNNECTNELIDYLGMDAINEEAARLGMLGTQLNRKMLAEGEQNYVTANDLALVLLIIDKGEFYGKDLSKKAKTYLKKAYYAGEPDGIKNALNEYGDVSFAHKTGTLNEPLAKNDAGIVSADHDFVLVVLTNGLNDEKANDVMGQIAKKVYAATNGGE